MPKRYSKKKIYSKSKQRRSNKKNKKSVYSFPRQIQSATYIPKNRLIRFTETRSYIVNDTQGLLYSYPPNRTFGANDPNFAFNQVYKNGEWLPVHIAGRGPAVHGIPDWVCLNTGVPKEGSRGYYKQAQALSSKIVVSAVPLPEADGSDGRQDAVVMCLSKTCDKDVHSYAYDKPISETHNAVIAKERYYTKSANLYRNNNGTPRGATISMTYSWAKMNAGNTRDHNIFHTDGTPGQSDTYVLAFFPAYSQDYGTGGTRLPQMRVVVKMSYIVLLSEPNTRNVYTNVGNDLGEPARIPDMFLDKTRV